MKVNSKRWGIGRGENQTCGTPIPAGGKEGMG